MAEVLVICAHPFPYNEKSSVNSLPVEMELRLEVLANMMDKIKSPTWEVVIAAPGVLLRVRFPVEVLPASGVAAESPETSQAAIMTEEAGLVNVGVTTVAPAFELTAYQISVDHMPKVPRAPAEP